MKFLNYLNEEYVGYWPEKNPAELAYPVFKNPAFKELRNLKACRFVLDDQPKSLFVSNVGFFPCRFCRVSKHTQIYKEL